MQDKNVYPITVFFHKETTTLNKLHEVANREIPQLYEEIAKLGVKEIAPMQFRYIGCTPDLDKEFELEIGVIVDQVKEYNGKFDFKEWGPMKCVSHVFTGPVSKLGGEYEKIFPQIFQSGKQPSDEVREVYTKFVDMESPENITEIQIGLN